MAAPSDVQLCNRALARLGEDPIASLEDNSDIARHCNLIYEDAVLELLAAHPWNFAVVRQDLVKIASPPGPPLFGFSHAYAYPTDPLCLRALDTSADVTWAGSIGWPPEPSPLWQVENLIDATVIVSNWEPLSLRYIGKVTSPVLMSPYFRRALVAELTAQLAYAVESKADQAADLRQDARRTVSWAKTMDGQEGHRGSYMSTALIDVRF